MKTAIKEVNEPWPDMKKLVREIHAIEEKIVAIKTKFHQSGQPFISYKDYRKLDELRAEATMLYFVRAAHRGKVHSQKLIDEETFTMEEVNDKLKEYSVPSP